METSVLGDYKKERILHWVVGAWKFSLFDSGVPQTITLDNVWAKKNVPKLVEGDQELACCGSRGRKSRTALSNWTEETLASLIVRVLETLV